MLSRQRVEEAERGKVGPEVSGGFRLCRQVQTAGRLCRQQDGCADGRTEAPFRQPGADITLLQNSPSLQAPSHGPLSFTAVCWGGVDAYIAQTKL